MNDDERELLARLADLLGEVAYAVDVVEAANEAFSLARDLREGVGDS